MRGESLQGRADNDKNRVQTKTTTKTISVCHTLQFILLLGSGRSGMKFATEINSPIFNCHVSLEWFSYLQLTLRIYFGLEKRPGDIGYDEKRLCIRII